MSLILNARLLRIYHRFSNYKSIFESKLHLISLIFPHLSYIPWLLRGLNGMIYMRHIAWYLAHGRSTENVWLLVHVGFTHGIINV